MLPRSNFIRVQILLLISLLVGCFGNPVGQQPVGSPSQGLQTGGSMVDERLMLRGEVSFGQRRIQAEMGDIANGATVSLIEATTGNTVSTTLTTPS